MTRREQAQAVEAALAGVELTCDMRRECREPVTYIDCKGFAYCTTHGMDRQSVMRCRKLRGWELRRLQRGEQIPSY